MLREIGYLKRERARIGLVVHQQIEHRRGLQDGEVARPVSHRAIGDLEQHFQHGPGFRRQRHDDGAEKTDQLNGSLDASAHAEKMPSGAAGDVLQFDAAERDSVPMQRFRTASASPGET